MNDYKRRYYGEQEIPKKPKRFYKEWFDPTGTIYRTITEAKEVGFKRSAQTGEGDPLAQCLQDGAQKDYAFRAAAKKGAWHHT